MIAFPLSPSLPRLHQPLLAALALAPAPRVFNVFGVILNAVICGLFSAFASGVGDAVILARVAELLRLFLLDVEELVDKHAGDSQVADSQAALDRFGETVDQTRVDNDMAPTFWPL